MGAMHVIGKEGDTKTIWDSESPEEVAQARKTYNDLTKKGYTAFRVKKDGGKSQVMSDFDPDAEKVILVPKLVGG